MSKNYIKINRASWNNRLETHLKSDFYNLENFKMGASSLKSIELDLLGDISSKKILHLQCHFGQDSISLARMGAQVTGIDLSDKAINKAKELAAAEQGIVTNFICCDVYELENYLNDSYDIVFTSYGTIGWLPDLDKWSKIIHNYLKPNGLFIMAEFHPFVWTFDDEFKRIAYDYFKSEPIIETESGTYANREANIEQSYVCWNHSLSEVFQSLLKRDLSLQDFKEYDYSPYNCFKNTIEIEKGKFKIKHIKHNIPMVYSIVAKKN